MTWNKEFVAFHTFLETSEFVFFFSLRKLNKKMAPRGPQHKLSWIWDQLNGRAHRNVPCAMNNPLLVSWVKWTQPVQTGSACRLEKPPPCRYHPSPCNVGNCSSLVQIGKHIVKILAASVEHWIGAVLSLCLILYAWKWFLLTREEHNTIFV